MDKGQCARPRISRYAGLLEIANIIVLGHYHITGPLYEQYRTGLHLVTYKSMKHRISWCPNPWILAGLWLWGRIVYWKQFVANSSWYEYGIYLPLIHLVTLDFDGYVKNSRQPSWNTKYETYWGFIIFYWNSKFKASCGGPGNIQQIWAVQFFPQSELPLLSSCNDH